MQAITREYINALLVDGYEVSNYQQPVPGNKPSARGDTDQPIYKYQWAWNGIVHSRTALFQRDSEKLDGMNE